MPGGSLPASRKKAKSTGKSQGLGTVRHEIATAADALGGKVQGAQNALSRFGNWTGEHDPFSSKPSKDAPAAKPKGKSKGGGKTTPAPPTQKQLQDMIAANPFNQLGQGLVADMKAQQAPVEAAISGQDTGTVVQNAENQALAVAGVTPGSSAAQWLDQNIAQANQNDQPMQKAMAAYGAQFEKGQQGVQNAIGQSGMANALNVTTAPEQTWLTDLAQHIQSNLSYYGQIPTGAAQNLPPALLYYLQQSGTGGSGGAGTEQLSQIGVKKPPGAAVPPAAAPSTNTVTTDTGVAPS